MKKLVVGIDDSMINRAIFEEAAKILDVDCIIAENGAIALEKIKSTITANRIPDVVIADIHMPVMDGLTFIKEMKGNPSTKYIPILVLTTETSEAVKLMGKEYGAAGWIVKPLNPDEVAKVVRKFLNI